MKRLILFVALFSPTLLLVTIMSFIMVQASTDAVYTVTTSADAGDGSLRQAILDANDNVGPDTIDFNLPPSTTIVLGGEQLPTIVDTLTIDGSTAVSLTISGDNQSRIFEIGPGANFTLTHVSLVRGFGALYINDSELNKSVVNIYNTHIVGNPNINWRSVYNNSYGIVTIQDSVIRDNHGGGIYNLYGAMTLENSIIENNSLPSGKGGGIYNHGGTLNLQNTVVQANYAEDGGGIYNIIGDVTISNSKIDNNAVKSNGRGGGIYAIRGVVTLNHSTVISNFGGANGGGISLGATLGDDGIINIEQSVIEQNSARVGGGISIEYGFAKINKSTISNNVAFASNGGGINNSYQLSIRNSTIYSNTAQYAGGGIISSGRPITLTNSTISGNSASYGGGIAFVSSGDLTLVK